MRLFGLFTLVVLLFWHPLQAQQKDIKFTRISLEQGLSQSTVKCSFKDSHGYMWFGTRDGLNRYDGYEMIVYRHNSKEEGTISGNYIIDIQEDIKGDLWVGTTQGLNLYNRESDSFTYFPIEEQAPYIADILEDRKGNIWVGTSMGLFLYDRAKKIFKAYQHDPKKANSLMHNGLNKLAEDHLGNIWIATAGGLDKFEPEEEKFTHYWHDPKDERTLGSPFVSALLVDRKGRLWVGMGGGGLALYKPGSGMHQSDSFISYRPDPNNPNSLCHPDVLSLTEDRRGRIWIGTQNGGISIFDFEKNKFRTLRLDANDPTSLSSNSVHSLFMDDQGSMWVGTWAGGVCLYSPYAEKFRSYKKVLNFGNHNTYEIIGDEDGNIWFGIEDGGLVRFDPKRESFKLFENENKDQFLTSTIISMMELNKDTLAIGYHLGGFALFDKRTAKFTHYFPYNSTPQSIQGIVKPNIMKSSDGNLWIGDWGWGFTFFDTKNITFNHYWPDPSNPDWLNNGVVFAICEDREKKIWFGTEGGLNVYDRQHNKFVHYMHDDQDSRSLSHNIVYSIFEDSKGNLWVGTGGGLNLFDRKEKKFTSFTMEDGLPNNVINSIIEDDKGHLWLGTNRGLSRFDPQQKTFRNFVLDEGLQGNEFNRNASYKAPDGTLYFAGTQGFTVFHPDSLKDNPHIPPVVLTHLQTFNKPVVVGGKDSPLTKPLSQTKEITLPYWQSVFAIEYAALNYTLPGKNQYAYKLEGFDKDWVQAGNRRLATYTNLNPGEYTFRVKASNNDGQWNEAGTFMKVIITPPYWMTWWFRSLVALFVIGGAITFYVVRVNAIEARKEELEKEVRERTTDLQSAKNQLQERQEEILQQQEELHATAEQLQYKNEELKNTQAEIEIQRDFLKQVNEQVMSSIEYAKTIQSAILPSTEAISRYMPDHFILYRPKDVVSGDFYWFSHIPKEKISGAENSDYSFIAAVDCTGHGVPGAFMSIIGNTLLNEIINQQHIFDPAQVLEQLDLAVKETISKAEGVNTAGMDVCLCRIERGEGNQVKVVFAGAKRPLYYIQQEEDTLKVLGGDRRSIGGVSSKKVPFTTKELVMEPGSTLYLTSDGYADQNNIQREKFGAPKLKKLIENAVLLPMAEQQEIFETALDQHQQGTDQRDDITIIGVKL